MKLNCWEYKKCGRHPGGDKVKELGECKAALEKKLDGVHGGRNAGRTCWVVAGTLCRGEVQSTYAYKYKTCKDCDFYISVRKEEGLDYVMLANLVDLLEK